MTEKKEYIKKEYVNKEKLDSRLQVRADQIVAKLIKRLEDKHGTDNEAKVKKLTDLTTKLNKINDRIKSEKTKALVTYLVEALEKKKAEYGTSDDIEEIFNILEE
jgi:predicted RND superfamily exporter protein